MATTPTAPLDRLDKQVPREPVLSTAIASLGWLRIPYSGDLDRDTDLARRDLGILEIAFRDGNIYRYYDVPRAVYDAMRSAPSVGVAFARHIKAAGFPTAKIRTITKAA